MKILLAPDKFKGSLDAFSLCKALSEGILKHYPQAEIITRPLADGGDGSLAILGQYLDLQTIHLTVHDPLGRPIQASYLLSKEKAFIELAAASGLALLAENERNCMDTSTYGTGQMIADALSRGAYDMYLFVGGSATNDAAMGICDAVGVHFFDSFGERLVTTGRNLSRVAKLTAPDRIPFMLTIICDVDNPLHGPEGAAYVYAPQKGASPEEVEILDQGLRHFAETFLRYDGVNVSSIPGAGAAGGVAGGAMAILGGELRSGIEMFMEMADLDEAIAQCDWVITGEGRLDGQTERGKVVSGVCQLAHQHQKPVIAICGDVEA
ncbi:MAG: glycerate kinase, partial [Bacteroidota bacterium]